MNIDDELRAWRDAAVTGGLPQPHRERWQPLRAGVVNLWEFEAAEYWYAGGWAQLMGRNETGKSSLMALTTLIPWLADTSSDKIDTLGRSGKQFSAGSRPRPRSISSTVTTLMVRSDAAKSRAHAMTLASGVSFMNSETTFVSAMITRGRPGAEDQLSLAPAGRLPPPQRWRCAVRGGCSRPEGRRRHLGLRAPARG